MRPVQLVELDCALGTDALSNVWSLKIAPNGVYYSVCYSVYYSRAKVFRCMCRVHIQRIPAAACSNSVRMRRIRLRKWVQLLKVISFAR